MTTIKSINGMTVIDDSDPNYKSLDEQLAEQRESQNEILAETKKQILHGIATGDADEYILEALGLACVALGTLTNDEHFTNESMSALAYFQDHRQGYKYLYETYGSLLNNEDLRKTMMRYIKNE